MFMPNKNLAFMISFSFQAIFAFSSVDNGSDQNKGDVYYECKNEMNNMFGQTFNSFIEFKHVLVWKISEDQKIFTSQDYSDGFIEFRANETFLIFTQNRKFHFTLYYWVGTETKLKEKKYVAKYAAMFFISMRKDYLFNSTAINLAREDQMFESESFIHTLNRLRRTPKPEDGRAALYRDDHVPLNGLNLYVVKMHQTREIMKIPAGLGLQLMILDICIVVEAPPHILELYPATRYCADGVSEMVRWRAYLLFKNLCKIVSNFIEPECVTRGSNNFKALVQLLEDKEYHHKSEIYYLDDGNKIVIDEDQGILLFKISMTTVDGQQMMVREEVIQKPINIDSINGHSNYILDSKSVAGILFVYGEEACVDEILWAIQDAEEYLHDKISLLLKPIRMRITSADLSKFPIDFKINAVTPHQMPQNSWYQSIVARNDSFMRAIVNDLQ